MWRSDSGATCLSYFLYYYKFHAMCTAADRVVQAINANGQKTAAKAKVVKFVVCKEQCTPTGGPNEWKLLASKD